MSSTEEIVELAQKLGALLGDHDVSTGLEKALGALQGDTASQQAIAEFNRFGSELEQKAAQGQPIEVADKQKLESLQQAVVMNPLLANFQQKQMDYVDLLRQIDDAIVGKGAAAPAPAQAGSAPSPIIGAGM